MNKDIRVKELEDKIEALQNEAYEYCEVQGDSIFSAKNEELQSAMKSYKMS